jgi:flagellar biosynthesis protein FlhG
VLTDTRAFQTNTNDNKTEIISVSSGKGGVGKTLTTIHLALSWQNLGKDVLIIDGDLGLANIDVVLGLHAKRNISDVIEGNCELEDIALDGPYGIKVLPSGSGITSLSNLTGVQRHLLSSKLNKYIKSFDVAIIDNGAGINSNVIEFSKIAEQTVVVTTPEPHAITDAYALIKVLSESTPGHNFKLLVNMSKTPKEAENVYNRLSEVARQFLGIQVNFLGSVPSDPQVSGMIRAGQIAKGHSIQTLAGQSWKNISQAISTKANRELNQSSRLNQGFGSHLPSSYY